MRHRLRAGEVRRHRTAVGKVQSADTRAVEAGMRQPAPAERGAAQIGAGEIALAHIRAVEARALELGVGEVDADRRRAARR